jgi:hypothetical protein
MVLLGDSVNSINVLTAGKELELLGEAWSILGTLFGQFR